jgi:hypothetical protein
MRQFLALLTLFLVAFFVTPELDDSNNAHAGNVVFAVPGGGNAIVQVDPRGPVRRAFFPNRGPRVNVVANGFGANVFAVNAFNRGRVNVNAFAVPSTFAVNQAFFNPVNPVVFASPTPASFGVFGNPFVGNQAVLLNGGFTPFVSVNRGRVRVNNVRVRGRCF